MIMKNIFFKVILVLIFIIIVFICLFFRFFNGNNNLFPLIQGKSSIPLIDIFNGYDEVCIQEPYVLKTDFENKLGQDLFFYKMVEDKTIFWGKKNGKFEKVYYIESWPMNKQPEVCYPVNKNICLQAEISNNSNFSNFNLGKCENE